MKQGDLFDDLPPPPKSRADQIFAAFVVFHLANPHVWVLFQKYAFLLISKGYENHSAYAIFERIRWDISIETTDSEVKLNNNYRPYYARLFHAKYPEHGSFFRNRKRTSEDAPASDNDQQFFHSGNPENEAELMEKLRKLIA